MSTHTSVQTGNCIERIPSFSETRQLGLFREVLPHTSLQHIESSWSLTFYWISRGKASSHRNTGSCLIQSCIIHPSVLSTMTGSSSSCLTIFTTGSALNCTRPQRKKKTELLALVRTGFQERQQRPTTLAPGERPSSKRPQV